MLKNIIATALFSLLPFFSAYSQSKIKLNPKPTAIESTDSHAERDLKKCLSVDAFSAGISTKAIMAAAARGKPKIVQQRFNINPKQTKNRMIARF